MLENGQMATLNIKDILPNRFQPRIHFDEIKLNELAESIRKYGLIQPIVVRQIGTKYEIIAGERRYKASVLANKETIPAIVVTLSDRDSEEIALLENIQREDLTPIEEAVSYKRILDIGYITQEELAKKIGKSQSAIANKIRLLNLDDTVQDALLHGKISERHARSLLKIHNTDKQIEMLNRIINERLTVKMTDHAIRDLLNSSEKREEREILDRESKEKIIETLSTSDKPIRRAVPVASHRIIKVNPPKELQDKLNKKEERGSDKMDIDKILEEAQDINVPEEPKPANDMVELMKQNPNTMESPLIKSEPEPEVTPEVEPGKFVTPVTNVETPSVQEPAPAPSVSFDSIFNQNPFMQSPEPTSVASNEEIKPIESAVVQEPVTPVETAPTPGFTEPTISTNIGASQSINAEPINNNESNVTINPFESQVPPVQNNENINPAPTQMEPAPSVSPEPAQPLVIESMTPRETVVQENVQPTQEQVQPSIIEPLTPVEPTPLNPVQIEPIQAMPEVQNSIPEVPVSPAGPTMAAVNPEPVMNIPDDTIIETNGQVNSEPIQNNGAKFRQVINLIRSCASEIEKLGYFIDVDEIDLANKYQVTFRIDKE